MVWFCSLTGKSERKGYAGGVLGSCAIDCDRLTAWGGVGGLCGGVAGLIFAKIVQAALERLLCIHLHIRCFEVVLLCAPRT